MSVGRKYPSQTVTESLSSISDEMSHTLNYRPAPGSEVKGARLIECPNIELGMRRSRCDSSDFNLQ